MIIFDTSCLSCFARAGRLEDLRQLVEGHRAVVARAVLEELDAGVDQYPELATVRRADWLETVPVDGLRELQVWYEYARVLGEGLRDVGESSTLAWAEVNDAIAVVDDQTAVNTARRRGAEVRRTLSLIADGVRRGRLSSDEASKLVDALIGGGARFPCRGAEFIAWGTEQGLL